jgi:Uma2 family endonuclease
MIDGVLHMAPSAFYEHGRCQAEFLFGLRSFLERQSIGQVVPEIDIFLPDGGDVLRPDVSFFYKRTSGRRARAHPRSSRPGV